MKRHARDNFYVVGEGILSESEAHKPVCYRPSTQAALRKFRFSRMGPKGSLTAETLRKVLAEAMTADTAAQPDSTDKIPAGFTYLGQFIDHDLTLDHTARSLGEHVTVAELMQGRSPALDLDCLYGRGPHNQEDADFYSDGVRLKMGTTAAVAFPDERTNVDLDGFDLPRRGFGSRISERRQALIPDVRNDENLVVAQIHLAFIRFHNRVVEKLAQEGTPSAVLFGKAREQVVKHYQWMIKTDFLPRLIDQDVIDDVFTHGRKFFEPEPLPGDAPTMAIEFSVAAYRLGHSMIRGAYEWNRVFGTAGAGGIATLPLLFRFSGTSGTLSPGDDPSLRNPDDGTFEHLPTNWIADFRRLFDFREVGRDDLEPPAGTLNVTKQIDTLLVDPLKTLPLGSFGDRTNPKDPPPHEFSLAFRNLTRGNMVELASGQQMAALMGLSALGEEEILQGSGGATLAVPELNEAHTKALVEHTPLWFYILREAELNGGRLTGVGARIVAEVFHRAMEGSKISIVRTPNWRPQLGQVQDRFLMTDLLLFTFEGRADLLNPLGD